MSDKTQLEEIIKLLAAMKHELVEMKRELVRLNDAQRRERVTVGVPY